MDGQHKDFAFVQRIIAGDNEAIEEFVGRCRDWCQILLYKERVPEQDHDDVVQTVWMNVFEQIRQERFRGDSSLKTWVGSIAHHKIVDYKRANSRQLVSIDAAMDATEEEISKEFALVRSLAAQADDPTLRLLLLEGLRSMDNIQEATILILHERVGHTIEEISEKTDIPAGTVSGKLLRARLKLRRFIDNAPTTPISSPSETGRAEARRQSNERAEESLQSESSQLRTLRRMLLWLVRVLYCLSRKAVLRQSFMNLSLTIVSDRLTKAHAA
jgi:RNA polymerase sigma-70 factor (ECF subfamily)